MARKNEALEKAEKNLKNFLKENPDLQEYQDEIDRRLEKCPTFESRQAVLSLMMAERLSELGKECGKLAVIATEEAKKNAG